MEEMIRNVVPSTMSDMSIDIEYFIALYNQKKGSIWLIKVLM